MEEDRDGGAVVLGGAQGRLTVDRSQEAASPTQFRWENEEWPVRPCFQIWQVRKPRARTLVPDGCILPLGNCNTRWPAINMNISSEAQHRGRRLSPQLSRTTLTILLSIEKGSSTSRHFARGEKKGHSGHSTQPSRTHAGGPAAKAFHLFDLFALPIHGSWKSLLGICLTFRSLSLQTLPKLARKGPLRPTFA